MTEEEVQMLAGVGVNAGNRINKPHGYLAAETVALAIAIKTLEEKRTPQ